MNSITCNLYPNIKKTVVMVKFRYSVFEYKPFEYAKISVVFLDVDDVPVDNAIYELNKSNGFEEWGNDDRFLEQWIKTQWD